MRAQEKSDEVCSGLPFLADLALGLSVLGCTVLHLLYQGPDSTSDEHRCAHLLKSKLLQRYVHVVFYWNIAFRHVRLILLLISIDDLIGRCVWQLEESDGSQSALNWSTRSGGDVTPPSSPVHKVQLRTGFIQCSVPRLRLEYISQRRINIY